MCSECALTVETSTLLVGAVSPLPPSPARPSEKGGSGFHIPKSDGSVLGPQLTGLGRLIGTLSSLRSILLPHVLLYPAEAPDWVQVHFLVCAGHPQKLTSYPDTQDHGRHAYDSGKRGQLSGAPLAQSLPRLPAQC